MLLANGAPRDSAVIWPVELITEFDVEPGPPLLGFRGDRVELGLVTLLIDPCPLSLRDVGAARRRACVPGAFAEGLFVIELLPKWIEDAECAWPLSFANSNRRAFSCLFCVTRKSGTERASSSISLA